MHKLLKRFEDIMVAVTFAEAAEYDEVHRLTGSAEENRPAQEVQAKVLAERAGR